MSESRALPMAGPPADGMDPAAEAPPSWRLLATLGGAGMLAGLLLVLVFQATQPRILAHQALVLRQAVEEVLGGPERYETLFVMEDALDASPVGADTAQLDRVYLGFSADGRPVGFAVEGGEPGFQDVVRLIFGYDPGLGKVLGMKVLESKETPGLGDKIEKDSLFVGEFSGVLSPLSGVKRGSGVDEPHSVDMITGATISSRTVIAIINHRLEALSALLLRYWNTEVDPGVRTP